MNIKGIVGEKVGHATVTDSKRAVIREGGRASSKPRQEDKPGTELTIVLPLVPRKLWPNGRPSKFARAKSVRVHRDSAFFATREAMRAKKVAGSWDKAEAIERFFWPDAGRRDTRNAEAANKSYFDGIVDAGLLTDDRSEVLTHLPSEFSIDRERPRLEITIRKGNTQ